MRTSGFTLLEMLVVLAILGVLLTLGLDSLAKHRERLAVRDAAQTITSTFGQAKYLARRHNVTATVTIDPGTRTVRLVQGTKSVAEMPLSVSALSVECRAAACPLAGGVYTFDLQAPSAALPDDVKVTLTRNTTTLNAYLLGPNGIEVIRP